MIEEALFLLLHTLLPMLRVTPGSSFPRPLTREEEERALQRAEKGDIAARNELVEHNLRLVAHIVKKYYSFSDETDDLISIGTIGLIKGIDTYRPGKGVRLATYASRCIENEILMHFRKEKKKAGDVSLSEALDVESDGAGLSLLDVVAQEQDVAETVCEEELRRTLREQVRRSLDGREARIIMLRYGLGGGEGLTQQETAQCLGISRSYVSRLEKHALSVLRRAMHEEDD